MWLNKGEPQQYENEKTSSQQWKRDLGRENVIRCCENEIHNRENEIHSCKNEIHGCKKRDLGRENEIHNRENVNHNREVAKRISLISRTHITHITHECDLTLINKFVNKSYIDYPKFFGLHFFHIHVPATKTLWGRKYLLEENFVAKIFVGKIIFVTKIFVGRKFFRDESFLVDNFSQSPLIGYLQAFALNWEFCQKT